MPGTVDEPPERLADTITQKEMHDGEDDCDKALAGSGDVFVDVAGIGRRLAAMARARS
jgi:hypothetical protein